MKKKKTRRQKNEELKRRYDAVKNLMSTFAMSTVAVVAVVTLIPASPKAEIIKAVALSEEIVYQVSVTDEENALDLDSLTVVLENQLEYYEKSIELGESSGFFDMLETNTEYRLSVYGDKGFGDERLDTEIISTKPKVGATILSVSPVENIHSTTYNIDTSVYDPDNKYSTINLYYGYSWEPDVEFIYSSIPITLDRQTIELFDVFTTYPFHIYIEGTTLEGTELLDEIWVTPPFELFADIYFSYLNNDEIAFHAYGSSDVDDLEYRMNVYTNNNLVKTDYYTPNPDYHSHNKWIIDGLTPDTIYMFECIAIYTNPQTLRQEEQIVYTSEISTTKDYSYTYDIESIDSHLKITVTLYDPEDVLSYVYFEVVDTTGEFDETIDSENNTFELIGEEKIYIFFINIPVVESYKISFGMRSFDNIDVNQIIKEIVEE